MSEKRVLAFDLDGTLLKKNSSLSFSFYLYKKKVFSLLDLLFCLRVYCLQLFFGRSLPWLHKEVFRRFFKGRNLSLFLSHIPAFLDEKLEKLFYPPAMAILNEGKKEKKPLLILSSSPHFLVQAIAIRLGVERVLATKYEVDPEGLLCGITEVVTGQSKERFLKEHYGDNQVVAYSDSILDLPFLEGATEAVAVKPDRELKKIAKRRGWASI